MAELFSVLGHTAKLKLKPQNLPIAPPTNLDVVCQTYVELVLGALGNDSIRANDIEVALDSKGDAPACPGADRVIPPVPSGLALRHPRFWLELPPAGATPKRPRDSVSNDSDSITDLPAPERSATLGSSMRDDILRQSGGSAVQGDVPRDSAADALKNPLRGYPEPIVLYGMDTDPTLCQILSSASVAMRVAIRTAPFCVAITT